MQLYLDSDGVLMDFDKRFIELTGMHPRDYEAEHGDNSFWKVIEDDPEEFFYSLELMEDAQLLFDTVKHLNPIILTGASNNDWAISQKTRAHAKHFPGTEVIVTRSRTKRDFMKEGKHNIIIDDWDRWQHLWEEHGGTWILHKSAEQSIQELKDMGIL